MRGRVKRNLPLLRKIALAKPKIRTNIIESGGLDVVKCFSDICLNICRGNLPLSPQELGALKRYKRHIRCLAQPGVPLKVKKALLIKQSGGALPLALLAPLIGTTLSILYNRLSK